MLDLLFAGALLTITGVSSIAALRLKARLRRLSASLGPSTPPEASAAGEHPSAPSADPAGSWHSVPLLAARDALWDWDLTADTLRLTRRWREMVGREPEEVAASSDEWLSRVHPADLTQLQVDIAAQTTGRRSRFESEHRVRHDSGRWITVQWVGTILRDEQGRAHRVAGSVRDTTAQRAAEERARREALYDSLTGLPNGTLARDLLQRAIRRTLRQGERRFAALLVDLDRFTSQLDALGFSAADELLRAVGRRLAQELRPGDVIARVGTDVFLLILDAIEDPSEAARVADRVLAAFGAPLDVLGRPVTVSASIGIAVHDPAYSTPADYLRNAELAAGAAKQQGGGRHATFCPSMRDGKRQRATVEQDLTGAIARGELVLWYQPVFAVQETAPRLVGFEALVRWRHPQRGLLGPHEFVSAAEDTGIIVPLGEWVMTEACRHVAALRSDEATAPWVSVNVAARQLADPGFCDAVTRAVDAVNLPPSRLRLEVTENVILQDESVARDSLTMLRDRGHTILMDDFGTGHASLSYLHRLPIGCIKIDRYFVGRMLESAECREIVRSVVTLAQSLRMQVVAEGVEEARQLEALRAMGCPFVQGFLLGAPVATEDTQRLVAAADGRSAR